MMTTQQGGIDLGAAAEGSMMVEDATLQQQLWLMRCCFFKVFHQTNGAACAQPVNQCCNWRCFTNSSKVDMGHDVKVSFVLRVFSIWSHDMASNQ
mmetsp:Transcript_128782/g.294032  ORF Transcript_128782/g.294032 Transcript_128782/m.294032 type:complete len:95 (-) Transcript_128782:924-1208(-)